MPRSSRATSRSSTRRTSGSSIRNGLRNSLLLLLLLAGTPQAQAQGRAQAQAGGPARARAAGRVLRLQALDSIPVAGTRVLLHQVGRDRQGPVDSTVTDAAGRFRFRFVPDTTAVYLVSARYAAMEYFGEPVHTNPARPDTTLVIAVYDTSTTQPIELEARHLVIGAPGQDGSRRVLDLVVLRNPGLRTRISSDSLKATWGMPLPPGSLGLEVNQSDLSPEALVRQGDSALLVAPITPGEKQLVMQYTLPGDLTDLRIPFAAAAGMVNVLLEEPKAAVTTAGLVRADTAAIEGKVYRRWTGALAAPGVVRISLPGSGRAPAWLLAALVGTLGLVLVLATWWLLARRGRAAAGTAPASAMPAAPAPASAGTLLDAIAALDQRYRGRVDAVPATEWAQYEAERAALKAALRDALAGESTRT